MRTKKALLIFLLCCASLIPNLGSAGFIVKERVSTYDLVFELAWYQKFFNLFLQYEFLSWKQVNLQELFIKTDADQALNENVELIIVSITPVNFNEAFLLKNAGGEITGFAKFIRRNELSNEGVKKLLEIINYLYEANEGEKEFNSLNFLAQENPDQEFMFWKINKKKTGNKYTLTIEIAESSKKQPEPVITVHAVVILDPLEKIFERVSVEIKKGPKFTLTKKPR